MPLTHFMRKILFASFRSLCKNMKPNCTRIPPKNKNNLFSWGRMIERKDSILCGEFMATLPGGKKCSVPLFFLYLWQKVELMFGDNAIMNSTDLNSLVCSQSPKPGSTVDFSCPIWQPLIP